MKHYAIHRPHGIMFHHFHDSNHRAGQGSLSAEEFAGMLDYVGVENILPAREWHRRAVSGALKERDVCLTFDDNLRCQFEIALPILKAKGLTAFWFVYTSVTDGKIEKLEIYREFRSTAFASVDVFYDAFFSASGKSPQVTAALKNFNPTDYLKDFRFYTDNDRKFRFLRDQVLGPATYQDLMDAMMATAGFDVEATARNLWMNARHLQELAREGHVVGLHSQTHPTALCALPAREQEREYRENSARLQAILGTTPETMAHPCNSYDEGTLRILRDLGVTLGFRSNMAKLENVGLLEFPREDHTNLSR